MPDDARIERLLAFRDAVVVPLSQTDPEKWPMRSGRVAKLVGDALADEFFSDIADLRAAGWSVDRIASLFGNPSRLWRFVHHLLNGLRASGASVRDQQDAVLLVLDLIESLKAGSAFCEDGVNGVMAPQDVTKLEQRVVGSTLSSALEDHARAAHRAAAALWAYSETLYFVAHEIGVEIHGPYPASGGRALLVRDFMRPHPRALWPDVRDLLDFESLRIAVIYERFDGWLDVYNNLYLRDGFTMLPHTTAVAASRDGDELSAADLEQLCVDATTVIDAIAKQVESWTTAEVARRYVDVFWWRKRELAIAARGDWRPLDSVVDRVVPEAIPPESSRNPSVAELRQDFDLTENGR